MSEKITIIAKKDLYNGGKCFTKGKEYEVQTYRTVTNVYGLAELKTTNDLGEPHVIGGWCKDFKIIK